MDRPDVPCVNVIIDDSTASSWSPASTERDDPPDGDGAIDRRALSDAEEFIEANWSRVLGALTIRTGDPALAEELAQEAFARAWANWADVSLKDHPVAWVHRVAWNLTNSHWRRLRVQRRVDERRADEPPASLLVDAEALAVRSALAELSERQRQVLVLRYYAGLDVNDTAAAIGIAPSTVTTLTARAMRRLRPLLDDTDTDIANADER